MDRNIPVLLQDVKIVCPYCGKDTTKDFTRFELHYEEKERQIILHTTRDSVNCSNCAGEFFFSVFMQPVNIDLKYNRYSMKLVDSTQENSNK